jgi:transcriptional regulator with XRE-family HTH domain
MSLIDTSIQENLSSALGARGVTNSNRRSDHSHAGSAPNSLRHKLVRACRGCGAHLASDNAGLFCASCGRARHRVPQLPATAWRTEDMRDALRSKDIGIVIQAYRQHPAHGPRAIPQTELASWLGITQGQLSRIENGRNRVRDLDKMIHYARKLGVPAELLWFEIDDLEPQPIPQQQLLRLPDGKTVPIAAPSAEPMLADSLLTTLHQYVRTDMLTGPYPLLPVVTQQARFIAQLCQTSHGRARSRIQTVCARFVEFLGWLHQDAGNLSAAVEYTNGAEALARETGDEQLLSYVRIRQSNLAADAGIPRATIELALAALDAPAELTPRIRAAGLGQLALGYAHLGCATECARTLDQALDSAAHSNGIENDLAGYCTPEFIAMEAAECWVQLDRSDQAITALEPSLHRWQPGNRRDLGRGLALLAIAQARTGQPDQALDIAKHALAIAAETRSARTEKQLFRVKSELIAIGAADHAAQLRIALHKTLR